VTVSIDALAAKVEAGEALTETDAEALAESRDIIAIGMLASTFRRRIHGSTVTFVRVFDLKLPPEDWPSAVPESAGEVRIFQTPDSLEDAVRTVERVRGLAPGVPVSAFCLFELSRLGEGLPVVLPALKRAGLELVTQAPFDRLQAPEKALEMLTDAGLQLARLTMNDTPGRPWQRVCRDVASLQTALGTIRAFAPLARNIDRSRPTTGYEDVKRVAFARLIAENVETIQVDWELYGPKLAQVALTFGADDIDSVSPEDDSSRGPRRSPVEEINRSIRAAGFEPSERDGRFARRG
jgi:aminodeoxyfutalosine synthase